MESMLEHLIEIMNLPERVIALLVVMAGFARAAWSGIMYMRRIAETLRRLEETSTELLPNHGSSLRDVIDRIEQMVVMNEQRHRAILEESGQSAWEADARGGFVWGSKAFLELTDRTWAEMDGTGFATCIDPGEREFVWGEWMAAVADARNLDIRFRLARPTDGTVCVHTHAYVLKNRAGKCIGYYATTRPICGRDGEICPPGGCRFGGTWGAQKGIPDAKE